MRLLTRTLLSLAAVGLVVAAASPAGAQVTDEQVSKALEKGRAYLMGQSNPDGSFSKNQGMKAGESALVFMTLAYMGEHPNRDVMTKGVDYLMNVNAETGFNTRQGYAIPIRIMGFSYIHNKLLGEKREMIRAKMKEDILRLQLGQATNGGWRYELKGGGDYDFSVTQWPILAMREASLVGIEFPDDPLRKALELYKKFQQKDGGWYYEDAKEQPSGSMTGAGTASLFIIADVLEPASGCPCRSGQSQAKATDLERRMNSALGWLSKNFTAKENPKAEKVGKGNTLYWLYCVERVGIAAGYKYFGTHHWYKEGAEEVLKKQEGNGSWGDLPNTCFAMLFLYKGRAPILFNKLKFDGTWNAHRRDIANLTGFIEHSKEQQFHWQIVDLKSPMDELHDAPILYITAETAPNLSDGDKKKLREFTDTGGTILFEASCGNPTVRKWFQDAAKEIWPEWPVRPLGSDHGSFTTPNDLKQRPEVMGADDGVRTFLFYASDDVSCYWQTKALAARAYLFNWGINLYTYATDGAPLRAKLAGRETEKSVRYKDPVKAGPRATIKVARVKHGGNWEANANYDGFKKLAENVKAKAGITLEVKQPAKVPYTDGGVAPGELGDANVAYIAGSAGGVSFTPEELPALKAFTDKGGFLWFEAVDGHVNFDKALRGLASQMKWELKPLAITHPLVSGKMDPGLGYNLAAGVEFRQSFRIQRLGRQYADLVGVYEGDKLVGVYSPIDVLFCITGNESFKCRGYKPDDAAAVGTNLAVFFSTLK